MQSPDPIAPVSAADRAPGPVRVIAVASGKGGVGKTSVSVNLATALVNAGQRTLLLDTDLGLANVDVMLGLTPRHTLADVFADRCELRDTIIEAGNGLLVVPAASGKRHMTELLPRQHTGLVHAFAQLGLDLAATAANCPVPAVVCDTLEAIIERVKSQVAPGTQVVIMSNGGFGGLHGRLADALS